MTSPPQRLDAKLLREGEDFEAAWAYEVATLIAMKRLNTPEADAMAKSARAATARVAARIEAARAITLDGLKVKARAILWRRNGEPLGTIAPSERTSDDARSPRRPRKPRRPPPLANAPLFRSASAAREALVRRAPRCGPPKPVCEALDIRRRAGRVRSSLKRRPVADLAPQRPHSPFEKLSARVGIAAACADAGRMSASARGRGPAARAARRACAGEAKDRTPIRRIWTIIAKFRIQVYIKN